MRGHEVEQYVADTHAILWHIVSGNQLSTEARRRFLAADRGDAVIYYSVMTLIEALYLQEKGKIEVDIYRQLLRMTSDKVEASYQVVDIDLEIAKAISRVPHHIIPEMPDRAITATALHLGLPLITKDQRMQDWEGVVTIW